MRPKKLTDADALMDPLDNLCDRACPYSKIQRSVMCSSCLLGDAIDVVDRASPVDAVEVVRCKNCLYRVGNACDYSAIYVRPNGYCQWGRRKEDDNH